MRKNKENKLVDLSGCFQAVVFKQLVSGFLAITALHKSFSWFIKRINVKSIMVFKNSLIISHPDKVCFRVLLMLRAEWEKHGVDPNGKLKRKQCRWKVQCQKMLSGATRRNREDLPAAPQEQTSTQSHHGISLQKSSAWKCSLDAALATNWRIQVTWTAKKNSLNGENTSNNTVKWISYSISWPYDLLDSCQWRGYFCYFRLLHSAIPENTELLWKCEETNHIIRFGCICV